MKWLSADYEFSEFLASVRYTDLSTVERHMYQFMQRNPGMHYDPVLDAQIRDYSKSKRKAA